jgi:putative acetyltransferase
LIASSKPIGSLSEICIVLGCKFGSRTREWFKSNAWRPTADVPEVRKRTLISERRAVVRPALHLCYSVDMPFKIRELHPDEARTFLEVHHAAIRTTAAADYPAEVIDAWSPLPITDAFVQHVRNNHEGEIRLAAILDDEIIGIGALVPQNHELRACYVSPEHGGLGAGRALVEAIEHIARQRGLTYLTMDSSITAERFYLRLGYKVVGRGEHTLRGGVRMSCAIMRKDFISPS